MQTERNGPWSWVSASILPASELLASFEKDWLRVSRLGMMVDDDMNAQEDEVQDGEVEEEKEEGWPFMDNAQLN